MSSVEFALYIILFSLAAAGAVAIILERKERIYRQGYSDLPNNFLISSVTFIFTGLIMIVSGMLHPVFFIAMHFIVPAGLFCLFLFVEKRCREFREYRRQQLTERVLAWEKAVRREPGNALLHAQIAQTYEELDNLEKALLYYEQAAKLDPAYQESWDLTRVKRDTRKKEAQPPEYAAPPKNMREKITRFLNKPL